jgi:phosphopantetheinyl transferase (holo-ACP synthase)
VPAVRVGVDLIEIERIRRALARHGEGFKRRCFTAAEIAYCDAKPNPPQHYAGRFAAKEAVGKALGSGVYFTWREIEVRGRRRRRDRAAPVPGQGDRGVRSRQQRRRRQGLRTRAARGGPRREPRRGRR